MTDKSNPQPTYDASGRDPLIKSLVALDAAISLLERGGRKAAPSDKIFQQMLDDYKAALKAGREAIAIKG